jgi:succinate dehydrogenase / fumarate reductase, cytochrome b subunit
MNLESEYGKPRPTSTSRRALNWFDPRGRRMGMWAFILNRVTGIGLVVYLAIHLVVLSLLAVGESSWDTFVQLARSPLILIMDVVLFAGLLIHGLNGIRVVLVGLGFGVRSQKGAFILLMAVALAVLAYAAFRVFSA